MMLPRSLVIAGLWGVLLSSISGQTLRNPSFEDTPQDATMPHGWHACTEGTTPDILPGPWGVTNRPVDGRTYVGLITRPDGSVESIGQRFVPALTKGKCYDMAFSLGHASTYADYSDATELRVYLGLDKCDRGQLIFEGKTPKDHSWQRIELTFTSENTWRYIRFEAVHMDGPRSSRGNLLLDALTMPTACPRT